MKYVRIDRRDWAAGLENLKKSCRVIGPVEDQGVHLFKVLKKGELPDLNCLNTRLSPKSIVYPQSEILFAYRLDEQEADHHVLKEVKPDAAPQVALGIRPCDAKAFQLVKLNFDTPEYKDPYWLRAFAATTFVGLACHAPCGTCFCTSAGCGPFHDEDLDILLADVDDHYLAKVLTEKGDRLLALAGWEKTAERTDSENRFAALKETAEAKIRSRVQTDRLKALDTTDLYEAPFWDDVAFSCINCGACTYVCPTCWCFDIQDETRGASGVRLRNWDSCMSALFTLHGSGHNPRGTKTHRVRQRFMHKLKYFVDKYDAGIQCVGCGRCVRLCPVNIDIRKVCDRMNRFDPSASVLPEP